MQHQTFIIEAEPEKGITLAQVWIEEELKMKTKGNPDVIIVRASIFSIEEARYVGDLASQTAISGNVKVVIIATNRIYHEAQNVLLKLFEEPPEDVHLFLVVPTFGGLLPTLRSRVQELKESKNKNQKIKTLEIAMEFIQASQERRNILIKKLVSGGDNEERHKYRLEIIALINGLEAIAYEKFRTRTDDTSIIAFLSDIATLRSALYDRSAPIRLILQHLFLILPKDLVS